MSSSDPEQKILIKSELIEASVSTDNKCPVCLQQLSSSQAFTSNCTHSFCFECILQWSRIRYNCPLCKQPYNRIIFSPVKHLEFSEYQLEPRDDNDPLYQPLEIIENPNTAQVSKASWLVNKEQAPLVFRMLVYIKKWYAYPYQSQSYSEMTDLKKLFNDEEFQMPVTGQPQNFINYKRVRRFRDISWQWHAQNPACTHRLMNFIHRELKALACVLKQSYSKLPAYLDINMRSKLMAIIVNKLKKVDIAEAAFLDVVKEFITPVRLAKHFQHELECFAKSTSTTLADYDAKCVYYDHGVTPSTKALTNLPSTLPVNLVKYRIFSRTNEPVSGDSNISVFTVDEHEDREPNNEMSDASSFCEEVEVPPQPSPQYITISSSRSRSRSKSPVKKVHKKLKEHYSRSRTRSRTRSRSKSSVRRRSKKLKKHRSRTRSMSIDSVRRKLKKIKKKSRRSSSRNKYVLTGESDEMSSDECRVKRKKKKKSKKKKRDDKSTP